MCSIQACAACTAVYVGSDVSDDGSIIVARSNDYPAVWGNHITVTPEVENEPGRLMPVSYDGSVKTEIPETTYQYTATPYMNSTLVAVDQVAHDAAASTNEHGVVMTMSVTAYLNDAARFWEPLISMAVQSQILPSLLIKKKHGM